MTTQYPQRLQTAATIWRYSSTAFGQFKGNHNNVITAVALDAPEVTLQFGGDVNKVTLGTDTKGTLFYEDLLVLRHAGDVEYKYTSYIEPGEDFDVPLTTVVVDFYKKHVVSVAPPDLTPREKTDRQPFARFLSRVATQVPNPANKRFRGRWYPWDSATSGTVVARDEGKTSLQLLFKPINKKVTFNSAGSTKAIDSSGFFFFSDRKELVTSADGDGRAVFTPDTITFYDGPGEADVVGRFFPAATLDIGSGTQTPTWIDT